MPTLPKWFETLKKDPKALDAGIHWLTPEETEAKRAELAGWYERGDERVRHRLPDTAFSAAKALVARFLPVGEGPTATNREGQKTRSWLLLDKQSPEELKLALSPVHPPFLWLPTGQTAATLKEAFTPYFLSFIPSEEKLERTVRGFLGTGAMNKIDLIQLHDRYKASAFLDGLAWGSAYPKDPFLDLLPKGPEGQSMARRYREQSPQGHPTFSFRSLHSKSVLRAEAHAGVTEGVNIFIGEIHYRPVKQAALIRELNQRLGTKYPEDLPVDLAGALIGLPFDPPEPIRAALPRQTELGKISFGLLCLDCLASDNVTAEKELRGYASHVEGSVRQLVANLALRRGLKALLTEMVDREQNPEFKKQLSEAAQQLKA
ncbi:hypothetical protein POL68_32140 [Stigmatella sp. ncwal1]|uniref:Uncharacterized protein n=1 Tax=Stigmatella ashevillensis TaxID=2995309 RepID=A0ABT5DHL3_9BACT|nr:hypothetical protein [Stigmatella ashevillena]MDC0713156.1 hypothetical protein [Stigmatella ashevillena]